MTDVLIVIGIVVGLSFIIFTPIILYLKFGWFKVFYHDVLQWHEPIDEEWFDGCIFCSRCKYCGKEIMQDSQGNWF